MLLFKKKKKKEKTISTEEKAKQHKRPRRRGAKVGCVALCVTWLLGVLLEGTGLKPLRFKARLQGLVEGPRKGVEAGREKMPWGRGDRGLGRKMVGRRAGTHRGLGPKGQTSQALFGGSSLFLLKPPLLCRLIQESILHQG